MKKEMEEMLEMEDEDLNYGVSTSPILNMSMNTSFLLSIGS
jgi:hypothetical protein